MRKSALALSCILLTGVAVAQQKPAGSSTSSTPATSKTPAASSSSDASNAAPGAQAPANPLTDAQAHEMLELTGAVKMKEQLTHGYINYFHTSMPFLPKDVTDDLEQSLDKVDLETPIIAIYKQHVSADDATAIIAFYKTPAGKDMIDAMPAIMQQSQQVGMQLGRKTAQEVIQRHRPEIEAAAKQYQEEHAPKPAPSLSSPGASSSTAPSTQPSTQGAAKPSGSAPAGSSATTPSTTTPQPK